jgi:hypothetical protein
MVGRLHGSDPEKKGTPATDEEKTERAQDIAKKLGENKLWHSHAKMIGSVTLWTALKPPACKLAVPLPAGKLGRIIL